MPSVAVAEAQKYIDRVVTNMRDMGLSDAQIAWQFSSLQTNPPQALQWVFKQTDTLMRNASIANPPDLAVELKLARLLGLTRAGGYDPQ